MLSTGIVGLQHAVANMCETGGSQSLNFKPQSTYLFWNSSGLYLFVKSNGGLCHGITIYFSHVAALQARNQLGKPGGAKRFLRGAQNF